MKGNREKNDLYQFEAGSKKNREIAIFTSIPTHISESLGMTISGAGL